MIKCQLWRCAIPSENCKDWMENRLTSSGRSSQEPQHWTFSTKFRQTCKESTSHLKTSVIGWSSCQCSMCDIDLERKDNEDSCAITSRKFKEYASNFNDGHWAFFGPGEKSKWYQGYATDYGGKWDLRASQMVEIFENSGHPVFQGVSPLGRGILKKKNNRQTIHFNGEFCNIYLLYRTIHSANQLCIHGAVTKWCGTNSGEASENRPESARKTSPEIQIKQEDLKSLVGIPRLPHASGNRMLQDLKDFNSMPFMGKIEHLRTTPKFYHPKEKGNHYVTNTLEDDGWEKAHFDVWRIYSAEKSGGFKAIRITWCRIRNWSSLEYWDCFSYWCSWYWSASTTTEYSRILRMDFGKSWSRKICEWNSSSQTLMLWTTVLRCARRKKINDVCFESSKPAVVNHGQCSQDSNNVKTKDDSSGVLRETVASTMREPPASSKSSSGGSGGSSNPMSIHPRTKSTNMMKEIPKEDKIWTTNPGCQKCKRDSFETRISKCVTNIVRHHDERKTDGAMPWDVILPVLKGRFKNQLEKEFTDEDWLPCLYLGSIKHKVWNL